MATKKVNIDIVSKDRASRVLKGVRGQLDRVKKSVFNLRNAFLGLGVGLVARDFIKTASEIENLKVRFKFLFDTVEEGQQAFQGLVDFAAKVPFQLSEIQAGAANLAVVSESAKEMNELLELTGDIAAASGLDFKTTAEQMMRVWSAGISSADLFRERGVGAMLGFEQGVRYSAEESKKHILDAFRSGTLEVKGASGELAKTFSGTVSMIQDKYLKFKLAVMDAAPFEFLKVSFSALNQALDKNFGSIERAGQVLGRSLVDAFMLATISLSRFKDSISPVVRIAYDSIKNLVNTFSELPPVVKSLGLLGFLMLGSKGKLVVLAIGAVVKDLESKVGVMVQKFADFNQKILDWRKKWDPFIDQEEINLIQSWNDEMLEMAKQMKAPLEVTKGLNEEIEDIVLSLGNWGEITEKEFNNMSEATQQLILLWKKLRAEMDVTAILAQTAHMRQKNSSKKSNDEMQKNTTSYWEKYTEAMSKRLQTERKMRREHKDKLIELEKLGNKNIFDNTKESLSALSGLNRGAFEAFKKFQIAEATINAYMAASTAFKTYAANPFMAYAVAASSLAKGMALVAQIQSLSYREHGGAVQRGKPYIVGEAGREMFVPNQSGNIIPNDQLGGAVNVNFNINTVDARGFNELLTNSRATIVGMINSAVNETGRQAII